MVEIPLHDQLAVSVNMDVVWTVVAYPREEDVATPTDLRHTYMLPWTVTLVIHFNRACALYPRSGGTDWAVTCRRLAGIVLRRHLWVPFVAGSGSH